MSSKMLLQEPEHDYSMIKAVYENQVDLSGKPVKKMKIQGTAIVTDLAGINGRAYPKSVLAPEVKRFNDKFIKRGRGIAELNHPRLTSEGDGKDYSVFEINLMKACAVVEELYFKGNDLFCKMAVVDDHPAGEALKALINAGYVPGYSLRGAGSVRDTGKGFYEVTDDYRLITIDVVGNPSFDDKALISSMYESIKGNKVQVLTEAVEMANKEFLMNCDLSTKIRVGKKEFNKAALESYFKKMTNGQQMI
jgi:hypothetical protein